MRILNKSRKKEILHVINNHKNIYNFIDNHCPSEYGLEETCVNDCLKCWGLSLNKDFKEEGERTEKEN